MTDIDGLTGLAEYRNGGLFIDTGVLALRDPADAVREHDVASTLVVEWRALTVALLDRLADVLRRRLDMDATSLPLAKVLEGGTWAAGRSIAREKRADGSPPLKVISDGTVILSKPPGREIMEGVTIVKHPLVQHKLTLIRDKNISTKSFRELLKEIGMLLCYEVTRDLPLTNVEIETPMSRMMSPRLAGKKLVFAPILRAGVTFAEGMLDLVPAARVAHIGLYREPESFVAVEYFFKAPSDLGERLVIVVAPVIATANTAAAAVVRLKERGAREIRFVSMLASPEGVERLRGLHPDVPIWTAAIDDGLDAQGFHSSRLRRRRRPRLWHEVIAEDEMPLPPRSRGEQLLHFVDQFAKMDRLRQHLGMLGRARIGIQRHRGEAGDEHDLDVGVELGGAAGELDAVHLRHDDVGEQQLEGLFPQPLVGG